MSASLAVRELTEAEARLLTDEVKTDAAALWTKLLTLYEGGAHAALGYSSWGDYYEAEFGGNETQAYRLLQSARVIAQLPIGSPAPVNEAQARELVPLLDQPEQLRDAWHEASANGEPTALTVREAVQKHRPVLVMPMDETILAQQQRQTLIDVLDRAVRAMEAPADHAEAEARRLLAEGDPGPFTPDRFDRVIAYATAFAAALRKDGIDGQT